MPITYKFTRVEPMIDKETNKVVQFVFGLTGDDGEGNTAYIDGTYNVPEKEQKKLDEYNNDEIMELAIKFAVENNWFKSIKSQIESAKKAPIRGSNIVI